jgi:hypothetical protein
MMLFMKVMSKKMTPFPKKGLAVLIGLKQPWKMTKPSFILVGISTPELIKNVGWQSCMKTLSSKIELKVAQFGTIKGDFKTAFLADNSIDKIKSGPQWSREEFERTHSMG